MAMTPSRFLPRGCAPGYPKYRTTLLVGYCVDNPSYCIPETWSSLQASLELLSKKRRKK